MKWIFQIVLVCIILAVLGIFGAAVNNPVITFFTLGWYVKNFFVHWHLSSLGWVLFVAVELYVVFITVGFFSWIYNKSRKIIRSFKRS